MDASQRDELLRQLLQQQAQLNMQISKLGIGNARPVQQSSPDGGAISNAHYFLTGSPVETVRVRLKDVPHCDEAFIAKSKYDPAKHELLDKRAPRVINEGAASAAPPAASSKLPRNELLTMTVPMLRLQPELRGVPDAEVPDKKALIVDMIMSRRETAEAV